jgi:uncharacterized membrane protein
MEEGRAMKFSEIPKKFFYYNFTFFMLQIISSVFIIAFASKENIFVWLYLIVPFISVTCIIGFSRYYNILLRYGRYFFTLILVAIILLISLIWNFKYPSSFQILYNNVIQYTIIYSSFPAFFFGYFLALIVNKPIILESTCIEPNSISFDIKDIDKKIIKIFD